MQRTERIAGVVLAGGRSSRMGGRDKANVELAGRTLLERATARLERQVDVLAVNAVSAALPYPLIADPIAGHAGPLAGILAAMHWARGQNAALVATAACDTPFFPADLVARLHNARSTGTGIALAASLGRVHPVFGLWPVDLAGELDEFVRSDARRSVLAFAERHGHVEVDFPADGFDPFFNINTPADLAEGERLAHKFAP